MKHMLIALGIVLLPTLAAAEPYASTLTVEEQERHDFMDVQQNAYPSGKAEEADMVPQKQPAQSKGAARSTSARQ